MPSVELTAPRRAAGWALDDEPSLVRALRRGDEAAYAALIRRMHPSLKRTARAYVTCDAVAEEVVQDTWLAAIDGIDRFEGRSSLSTWLFAILINQAKTRGTRERRAVPFSQLADLDEAPTVAADRFQPRDGDQPGHWSAPPRPWEKPDRRLISLELRERLRDALEQVPERQRMMVALCDIEGVPAEEVCSMLDLTPQNQRVLLHRGRARLRSLLEAYVEADLRV
jgi:RNA polymerase sigma-70 factor (ECF subfamily)